MFHTFKRDFSMVKKVFGVCQLEKLVLQEDNSSVQSHKISLIKPYAAKKSTFDRLMALDQSSG